MACRAGPGPELDRTKREQAWLDRNALIRHVPIPDYAPVESDGTPRRPVGIAPDSRSLMAERLGVTIKTVHRPVADQWGVRDTLSRDWIDGLARRDAE